MYQIKICKICNNKYIPNCSNAKYCSNNCRNKAIRILNSNRRKKSVIKKICVCCNNMFKTSRSYQKACKNCKIQRKNKYNKIYYKNIIKNKFNHLDKGKSYPQQFIFNTLKEHFSNFKWQFNNRSILINPNTKYAMELDILCLDKMIAIEYDGQHHFSSKIYGEKNFKYVSKLDEIKDKLCEKLNIKLLRIKFNDNWKDKCWIINLVGEILNGNC